MFFDYRPLLCLLIGLVVSGMGFVSMGLFFSSIGKNQIIAAVLTFTGMLAVFLINSRFVVDLAGPMLRCAPTAGWEAWWRAVPLAPSSTRRQRS